MKYAIVPAAMLLLLSACTKQHFDISADVLPSVQGYTPEQQTQAADEMQGGQCPMLNNFMNDYMTMRDEARAAKGDL